MSTDVKVQRSGAGSSGRAVQGAATRAALIGAARSLFGTTGYTDTSLDDIVSLASVTKGALYHHFRGKDDLFAAVYEEVQREVSDRVVEQFLLPDPWQALELGCELWIDAHLDKAVQRIAMRDARAVLGWQVVRDVESRFGAVPLRGALRRARNKGLLRPLPLRPLSLMVMGALSEACFYVADADDPVAARAEVGGLTRSLLSDLAIDHPAAADGAPEG